MDSEKLYIMDKFIRISTLIIVTLIFLLLLFGASNFLNAINKIGYFILVLIILIFNAVGLLLAYFTFDAVGDDLASTNKSAEPVLNMIKSALAASPIAYSVFIFDISILRWSHKSATQELANYFISLIMDPVNWISFSISYTVLILIFLSIRGNKTN